MEWKELKFKGSDGKTKHIRINEDGTKVINLNFGGKGVEREASISITKSGYSKVLGLCVHRLVYMAFCGPIPDGMEINHIEVIPGKIKNNHYSNLELVTPRKNKDHAKENNLYAIGKRNANYGKTGKNHHTYGKRGTKSPRSKTVIQLSLDGEYINKFGSTREAERETGIAQTNISSCCRGKVKSAGSFKWIYLEDYEKQQSSR